MFILIADPHHLVVGSQSFISHASHVFGSLHVKFVGVMRVCIEYLKKMASIFVSRLKFQAVCDAPTHNDKDKS